MLKQNGVDLSKVVEPWLIADERRKNKLTRAELDSLTFTLDPDRRTSSSSVTASCAASALALHSHALSAVGAARDSPRRRR